MDPSLITMVAYIDPGSGSLMIQLIIGSLLGALLFAKTWIKALWKKITGKGDSEKK